eukprot:m.1178327 g.1178327  ORF g.1178327 m.1178327 type:complete len:945 (+) comp24526_c0_seq3:702-3536(+)
MNSCKDPSGGVVPTERHIPSFLNSSWGLMPTSKFQKRGTQESLCSSSVLSKRRHSFLQRETKLIRKAYTWLVHNSSQISSENVTLYSSSFMAITEFDGAGRNTYDGVNVLRRPVTTGNELCGADVGTSTPSPRLCLGLVASNADVFHSSGVQHGPTVTNCEFTYAMDDYCNVHSRGQVSVGMVVDTAAARNQTSGNEALLLVDPRLTRDAGLADDLPYGTVETMPNVVPGMHLAFHDVVSLQVMYVAEVVATRRVSASETLFGMANARLQNFTAQSHVRPGFQALAVNGSGVASRVWTVTLAHSAGNATLWEQINNTLIDVVEWSNNGSQFINNYLHDGVDGFRWKSSGALIANNLWRNAGSNLRTGLEITPLRGFLEGPFSISDVSIENNTFTGLTGNNVSGELIKVCTGMEHRANPPFVSCSNITLRNNSFPPEPWHQDRRAEKHGAAMIKSTPGSANCTEHWFDQTLDHFDFGNNETFRQRFFVCSTLDTADATAVDAIWFYCGNEANVELYVNATGLMWENAKDHRALMVFAEHRFYGATAPAPRPDGRVRYEFLTMEQALADYNVLIRAFPQLLGPQAPTPLFSRPRLPVVAFGGSYGGMLAAWLRMKYSGTIAGAISASAPILAFPGMSPPWDTNAYWQVVTRDATPAAGAAAGCDTNVRTAFQTIFALGATADGRKTLQQRLRICPHTPVANTSSVQRVAMTMLNAWDTMAMGNFPFPSDYLVFQQTGDSRFQLPAFPVRVACSHMGSAGGDHDTLLDALQRATAVLYNVTKSLSCLELPADPEFDGIWDYQWCTELLPQETYFSLSGKTDMFWDQPMNMSAINEHCQKKYGVKPRAKWIADEFGGMNGVQQSSNIVFTNGLFDPWSSGGVGVKIAAASADNTADFGINNTVKAVVIPNGAHHLDLMFSTPHDPSDVLAARKVQLENIARWTADWNR